MKVVLSVVVPVYNEEEVLDASYKRLTAALSGIDTTYELIFVNDGSRDKTPDMLTSLAEADENVRVISFSRNFGHQAAISAGMEYSTGDAVVVIDADLQDPPELIPKMVEKWREGYDVVYGRRTRREGETAFKKATAAVYYRLLRSMTTVDIPVDAGDFRLIDRKVCDVMSGIREHNRYIRGLISWVGFRQCAVDFVREERFAGETKYPLRKMIELSINGVASFSNKPLRLASVMGILSSAVGFVWLIVLLIRWLIGYSPVGWAPIVAVILFTQGLVLLAIGVLGEYLGRVYEESKGRPRYIVRETKGFDDK